MFLIARKNVLVAGLLAASFALFGCNSTSSEEDDLGGGPGGSAAMTYDGRSWNLAAGVCPGTTDYVTTFSMTSGEESLVLYVQGVEFPEAGTYTVTRGVDHPDSLAPGEVAVSLYDLNFNATAATGGSVTITRPSGSTLRFESASVTFDSGKAATFAVTATLGCSAPN